MSKGKWGEMHTDREMYRREPIASYGAPEQTRRVPRTNGGIVNR